MYLRKLIWKTEFNNCLSLSLTFLNKPGTYILDGKGQQGTEERWLSGEDYYHDSQAPKRDLENKNYIIYYCICL